MKKFSVYLIEDSYQHYLSIDNRDHTEYFFKNRRGMMTRHYNDHWVSRSRELSSPAQAQDYLPREIKLNFKENRDKDLSFSPGKILRDHSHLLDRLKQEPLAEWKIIFRVNCSNRFILNKEGKKKNSDFKYFSVLVKFRLQNQRQFLEVGEGSSREARFNQAGLVARVRDIIENQENRKEVLFPDKIPVILGPGDGGIFFHELLGHSLEADYLYKKLSPVSLDDLGKQIVSKNVTLSTGHKEDRFFKEILCDDEGEAVKSTTLVKNGVFKNVIADSFYRHLLNLKGSGHARAENFTRIPMPRMYALYLKPGNHHPEELVKSTQYGVLAREFGEGKMIFNKNLFCFNIKDAYLVENGKRTQPLGNIVVRGNVFEALNSVSMVGNDFRFDKGISYCRKNGQTLNVRVGQPTVKIDNLYVSKDWND